jgi:hypothetical protein
MTVVAYLANTLCVCLGLLVAVFLEHKFKWRSRIATCVGIAITLLACAVAAWLWSVPLGIFHPTKVVSDAAILRYFPLFAIGLLMVASTEAVLCGVRKAENDR